MTLKFNRVLEVVKTHVHAKFHQVKYSGSKVIVLIKKKIAMMLKTILPFACADSNYMESTATFCSCFILF